jgi:glycosyltransferase 2 family protein
MVTKTCAKAGALEKDPAEVIDCGRMPPPAPIEDTRPSVLLQEPRPVSSFEKNAVSESSVSRKPINALRLVKVAVSIGILAVLFYRIDTKILVEQFLKIPLSAFAIAFALLLTQSLLSAYKWQIIIRSEGPFIPYTFLLRSYLIGNFLSLFLPSSFGGDVYRIYALRTYNKNDFQNTSSVLFDRISGLFALLTLSLLSFTLFYRNALDGRIFFAYAGVVIVFLLMTSQWFLKLTEKVQSRIVSFPRKILVSFNQYKKNIFILTAVLFISIAFQSNIVIINKVFASALRIDIDIFYLFMVIPLVLLTEALPISINGLGVREGALVFFMQQAGFSVEQGLALGLLVISSRYVYIIPVGGILFFIEMIRTKTDDHSKKAA